MCMSFSYCKNEIIKKYFYLHKNTFNKLYSVFKEGFNKRKLKNQNFGESARCVIKTRLAKKKEQDASSFTCSSLKFLYKCE